MIHGDMVEVVDERGVSQVARVKRKKIRRKCILIYRLDSSFFALFPSLISRIVTTRTDDRIITSLASSSSSWSSSHAVRCYIVFFLRTQLIHPLLFLFPLFLSSSLYPCKGRAHFYFGWWVWDEGKRERKKFYSLSWLGKAKMRNQERPKKKKKKYKKRTHLTAVVKGEN